MVNTSACLESPAAVQLSWSHIGLVVYEKENKLEMIHGLKVTK